ncbi:MAG: hypothetical protein ABSA27_10365 [Terriglobales bacterium]|jgi:ABC-type cobalt transport system substrate-binding protein
MTQTGTLPSIKPLARRFGAPAISAWLLYMGVWSCLFVIEQAVMALLTGTESWFVDHFLPSSGFVETTFWATRIYAANMGEGVVLILLGLSVGWRIARRKRQPLRQPG